MCCNFFRITLFLEKLLRHFFSEWLLRHNSYILEHQFFLEQLLFSPFSKQSLFCSSFFKNSFFFRAKILQISHFLRIRSSLRQLHFGKAALSLFRIKISKKELLFQSRYFCTAPTFSGKLCFGKDWFFRKSISALPTFSGELYFWSNYFFERRYLL